MDSGANYFLKKALGEDFLESLQKVELWKPGTKSTLDHEEMRTALQIVPRTIIALLIRELATLSIGQNKRIELFVASGAHLNVTKHERDVYSGDIDQAGKRIAEFKFRSLPGIGLIIMSTFELYDMENLINTPVNAAPLVAPAPTISPLDELGLKVQKMIDERLALHDLVERVVDKKMSQKEAVHSMLLMKLTEELKKEKENNHKVAELRKLAESSAPQSDPYFRGMTNGIEVAHATVNEKEPNFVDAPKKLKKSFPVKDFLEARKAKIKKMEYSVHMSKSETVDCPDCGKNIFNGKVFSGCICLGDDMERKVFIKKSETGLTVRFSRGWDQENIEMLLEVLRRKRE